MQGPGVVRLMRWLRQSIGYNALTAGVLKEHPAAGSFVSTNLCNRDTTSVRWLKCHPRPEKSVISTDDLTSRIAHVVFGGPGPSLKPALGWYRSGLVGGRKK